MTNHHLGGSSPYTPPTLTPLQALLRGSPTVATVESSVLLRRHFSTKGVDPFDEVEWETCSVGVGDFAQDDVEFPVSWSIDARNIVAQKYFRGQQGTPERETSLRQVIGRVVARVTEWATGEGTVPEDGAQVFADELTAMLLHQRMAFNSPVWFNLGVPDEVQQGSACFILSVEDSMTSILDWIRQEGIIFKGGSGAGVNLSALRASTEHVKGGGLASGPVSFMRGADASAGTIKSGGKTRRAAKMVLLDVEHPDVEEFIWCKAREERKARVLEAQGFEMGMNGRDAISIQYQNANNSVRLSDAFMHDAAGGATWNFDGRAEPVDAAGLLRSIAEAAHECADPGVQFTDTINAWHTLPAHSPINASNPCSEYLSIDDSACNLASLNLLTFMGTDDVFDIEGFRQAVNITILAMDAIARRSDYPTEKVAENARKFRQLGLGYTNLGALLMTLGVAYDSDDGRGIAAAITSLMTGEAYAQSTRIAERCEPFFDWDTHKLATLDVLDMHHGAASDLHSAQRARNGEAHPLCAHIARAGVDSWETAIDRAAIHGVANAQATVLAPTGTISFFMDADTTGIEPDWALAKDKTLSGGGVMRMVNASVWRALHRLGYNEVEISMIMTSIESTGEPGTFLRPEHTAVFATSVGTNAIDYMGHVRMLAAVQPFISGAISKTVNLPTEATVEDFEHVIKEAWTLGVKCLALYRDGSKVAQPLATISTISPEAVGMLPVRLKLPKSRSGKTISFRIGDCKGYLTTGEYEDGRLGEIFLKVAKQGSSLSGVMDGFAIAVSHGLQYGVPLASYCKAFMGTRFDPAGITDEPDIRMASSIMDYVFRKLAIEYLSPDERDLLGIYTAEERIDQLSVDAAGLLTEDELVESLGHHHGVFCMVCGSTMVQSGTCMTCAACGNTTGCG